MNNKPSGKFSLDGLFRRRLRGLGGLFRGSLLGRGLLGAAPALSPAVPGTGGGLLLPGSLSGLFGSRFRLVFRRRQD